MRVFKKANLANNWHCPICKTSDEDEEVVLIPIYGTKDGSIVEAEQVHLECLVDRLYYYKGLGMIAVRWNSE